MESPYVPVSAETVTEDWLKKVLAGEFKSINASGAGGAAPAADAAPAAPAEPAPASLGSGVVITSMQVAAGASKLDGFLSRMQQIVVKARKERPAVAGSDEAQGGAGGDGDAVDDDEREFHLMAKLYPPGEIHQKMVRNLRVFEREIHVYTEFQQMVMEHQKHLSEDKRIRLPVPRCYFAETGLDASCIVMEDLRQRGFRMNDKRVGMTLEHARLGLKAEATYAALGFNVKQRIGVERYLMDNGPLLIEPFDKTFGLMMDFQIFPGIITFAKGQGRQDLVEKLEQFSKTESPYTRFMKCIRRCSRISTFGHGDCWNNNYMFRFEKNSEGKEVPIEAVIVDLQISRYIVPTLDMTAFILSNMEADVRDAHLDDLIRAYYETFASTLERLDTPNWSRDSYTLQDFMLDVDLAWEYGFIMATWLVPVIMQDDKDLVDFDEMKDEKEMMAFMEEHEKRMATKSQSNEKLVRRVMGVLEFGVNRGII